jgi:hypothetical protein
MQSRRYIYLAAFLLFGLGFAAGSPQEYAGYLEQAQALHYSGKFDSASEKHALAIACGAQRSGSAQRST